MSHLRLLAVSSVLQPNSPQALVATALASVSQNKARAYFLARRIFFSFRMPGRDALVFWDISRFFPSLEMADAAF
ncbi:hypothetical protein EI94DRAFT_1858247 [Lactarius quietus]|nr:hypothetical protein EI94DRAFT_1858247 [Lactarius quietus]